MSVLQGKELFNHLDSLITKIENQIKTGTDPHNYTLDFFKTEKEFLKKQQIPTLSFSSNGFPSIDSIKQDYSEIARLNGDLSKNTTYNLNVPNMAKYSQVSNSKIENILKNKKIDRKETSITFKELANSIFSMNVKTASYVEGDDKASRTIPLIIEEHKLEYQILWSELFSKSSTIRHAYSDYLFKSNQSTIKLDDTTSDIYSNIWHQIDVEKKDILKLKETNVKKSTTNFRYPENTAEFIRCTNNYRKKNSLLFIELLNFYIDNVSLRKLGCNNKYGTWEKFDFKSNFNWERKDVFELYPEQNGNFVGHIQMGYPNKIKHKKFSQIIAFNVYGKHITSDEMHQKLQLGLRNIQNSNTIEELINKINSQYSSNFENYTLAENDSNKSIFERLLGR